MPATTNSAERAAQLRRAESLRDLRGASARGESLEQRSARGEQLADQWTAWFHREMKIRGCSDPTQLLPDLAARIEQVIDDRVAMAVKQLKATLRKALTS
jgi:hypothetical protein